MKDKTLIVIGGPTGVGKTALGIHLAQKLKTEILSADSRQIYKELNIGVAKPSQEELDAVPHYFINYISVYKDYNAGEYAKEARTLLEKKFRDFDVLLMVGGSGLYIKACLDGFDPLPGKDKSLRSALQQLFLSSGLPSLKERLQTLDANNPMLESDNPQRIIREIEILSQGGRDETVPSGQRDPLPYRTACFYLNTQRQSLYDRINHRVNLMISEGLEEEARSFYKLRHLNALQTVGYTEFFRYFDGEISRAEAIALIKQHSRNYAKRQLTWFRNDQRFTAIESERELMDKLAKAGI